MTSFGFRFLAIATQIYVGSLAGVALAAPLGETVFQSACIACHGVDGAGALPGVLDLTAADSPLGQPDAVLLKRTIEGFQRPNSTLPMPPRAGNPDLSDEELMAAIRYMRERFGKR